MNKLKKARDRGVLDYLIEMRNLSELIVDLAYSSLLLDDKKLAEDVIELKKKMSKLKYELELGTVMSRLPLSEAEGMVAVLEVAETTEGISSNAKRIAEIVLKGLKKHPILRQALQSGETGIYKYEMKEKSLVLGKTLGELNITEGIGMRLLAIKKKNEWQYMPEMSQKIGVGDVLLITGPSENKELLDKIIK